MKKISDDVDLRKEVQRKCKNDWNLDLDEDQITSCLVKMEKTKLSVFHGQIWPNVRNVKAGRNTWEKRVTWAISIDGYRAIAHRNGLAGIEEPSFITDDSGKPVQASIRVYRIHNGVRSSYIGSARYSEFVQLMDEYDDKRNKTGRQIPNHQWQKSPFNQLAMAAERQALRRGFQETLFDDDVNEIYDPDPEGVEDSSSIPTGESNYNDEGPPDPVPPPAPPAPPEKPASPSAASEPPDFNDPPDDTGKALDDTKKLKDELRPLLETYRQRKHPDQKMNKKFIRMVCKELLGVVINKGSEPDRSDLAALLDTLREPS